MSAWQRFAIALARSSRAQRIAEPTMARTVLARRFIEYGSAEAAVTAARRLRDRHGITSSLFYLGEYVDDPTEADRTVKATCEAATALIDAGLEAHVSIDPTAIGSLTSPELCLENALRIGRVVARSTGARRWLMIDMEDLNVLDPTLALFRELRSADIPTGVTLQARLRRTAGDLAPLTSTATSVRLVKGAFPLGVDHDYQSRHEISRSFVMLAETMLSTAAKEAGFYPSFATHDDVVARRVIDLARDRGWSPGEYEFEFLYGVRENWQRELRARGHAVRVYLPFGTEWWPYVMRRVGENPRNLLLVTRRPALRRIPHEQRDAPGMNRTCARGLGNRCSIH
jgi:proline dehydrogenase